MNYLSVFLVGLIVGLLGDVFFFFYSSNKHRIFTPKEKEKGWATKDDIFRITNELENLKNIYKTNHKNSNNEIENNEVEEIEEIPEIDENSDAEKEFYESIAGEN